MLGLKRFLLSGPEFAPEGKSFQDRPSAEEVRKVGDWQVTALQKLGEEDLGLATFDYRVA
ncbi:MAG: hypothetical protein PVF55_07610 [Desulfobacterales bacterium]|jgi:hypothetical protein